MIDLAKTLLGLFLFLVFAPAFGFALARRPAVQRVTLAIIIVATTMPQTWWSVQIASMESYRGHTRGYEVNFLAALALGSVIGALHGPLKREARFWTPTAALYFLFVVVCTFSLKDAIDRSYVMMAFVKFASSLFVLVAAYNSLRGASDLRLMQNTLAAALIWQFLLCMKMKYVDGIYRLRGNFPHSNNLGMYAYVSGLFLLSTIQQARMSNKRLLLIAGGYVCAIGLAFVTISRACFAAAIVGSGGVMALSILIQPRLKKFALASTLILPVAVGSAKVADQILARSQENSGEVYEEFGTLRNAMEEQAKAMLADHSWGVGWNNFCLANSRPHGDYSEMMEQYILLAEGYRSSGERHPLIENLYWMILGETGYLAFVVFVVFQLWLLSIAWRSVLTFRMSELGAVPLALSIILPIQYWHWYYERIITDTPMLLLLLVLAGFITRMHDWKVQIKNGTLTQAELLAR